MHVLNLRVHLERVNLLISGGKPTDTPANILDWYKMGIATKLRKIIKKEITKKKNKNKQNKKASPPVQDFYPDSDRIRGTMLYPLSCGELAMHGKKI